jgi:hypothetical protein
VPVSTLDNNTEILLNNMLVEFEKTDTSINTPDGPVLAKRVDVPRLINWLTAYQSYQEGGETKTVGLYDLIKAIKDIGSGSSGSSFDGKITEMPDVNISIKGLGSSSNNPIYISGGGFPTKDALAAEFYGDTAHGQVNKAEHFVAFNYNGAVGYISASELANRMDITTLVSSALSRKLTGAYVNINGTHYDVTFPNI